MKKANKSAIVIGSGFGGLSIAIRLQARGYSVKILEKQAMVGGHAYQLKKKGYTFDLGPSLITEPKLFRELFEIAGENFDNYIQLIKLDPFYRIYFHDKTFIDYNDNTEDMIKEISKFSKSDANNYTKFQNFASRIYQQVMENDIGSIPFTNLEFLKRFYTLLKLGTFLSPYQNVKRFFKNEKIRFTFSFHSLFIGGSPFTTPGLLLMIPYLEKKSGAWFTNGGMYSVIQVFEKLFLKIHGEIITNCEVKKLVVKDKKITKVITEKGEFEADIIVSNAHFAHTYLDLLDSKDLKKNTHKKVLKKDYSMSAFLLYIGVKKQYSDLKHHTLILSERYKGLVDDIFKNKILTKDMSMYLHVPTKTDPKMAPDGCESMYVLVPVPNLLSGDEWDNTQTKKYTDQVLDFLENDFGLSELRENIEVLETFTPLDFKNQRNNHLGAAWSVNPSMFQSANFRPRNKSDDINNLYLVGASTHPGAGVPGVILSAKATDTAIKQDEKQ